METKPHQAVSRDNTRHTSYHSEQTNNDDAATNAHFATMGFPLSNICESLRVAQGTNIRRNQDTSAFSRASLPRAQYRLPRPFVDYQNELPTYHEAVRRSPTMDRLDILQYGLGFFCFIVGLLLSLIQGAFLFPVGLKVGAASLVLYVGFYALFAVPFFFKQQSALAIPCCFLTFGICTVSTLAWARQAAIHGVL